MTRRLSGADAIAVSEHMPAAATHRPVLDNLIDRPRRQQQTALALMTRLRALLSPRGVLAAPRRRARRSAAAKSYATNAWPSARAAGIALAGTLAARLGIEALVWRFVRLRSDRSCAGNGGAR